MHISDQKFYDKVAKKVGGYKSEAIHKSHFPNGNPEEIFLEQLVKYSDKDRKGLKEIFGRGQGFGEWDISVAKTKIYNLVAKGFKVVFVHDYFYSEIYPDIENLNLFLQSVPIFKDFDQEKDKENLRSYSEKFSVSNGIELKRHRIVIVAEKL